MKVLWCDTETTGLSAFNNGIIQISGIIEIDNIIMEKFNIFAAPFPTDKLDAKALQVNKTTEEEIRSYPPAMDSYKQVLSIFNKYVDKFNRNDKMILAGYNVNFDAEMLRMWFKKAGNNFFYSYFYGGKLDVLSIIMAYCRENNLHFSNHKLKTIATHFGINANFHDALDDIIATREIYLKVLEHGL